MRRARWRRKPMSSRRSPSRRTGRFRRRSVASGRTLARKSRPTSVRSVRTLWCRRTSPPRLPPGLLLPLPLRCKRPPRLRRAAVGVRDYRGKNVPYARVVPLRVNGAQLEVHLLRVISRGVLQARNTELEQLAGHLRPDVGYPFEPGHGFLALRRYAAFVAKPLALRPRHSAPYFRRMFSIEA